MKEKADQKKGKVVWKDSSLKIVLILLITWLVPSIFISILLLLLFNKILGICLIIISIALFIFFLKNRAKARISIYSKGISMGNVRLIGGGNLLFNNHVFLRWSEISDISLKIHSVKSTYVRYPVTFLNLKSKKGKLYRFGILQPKNFVVALWKVGKINLLDKKSKEKFR